MIGKRILTPHHLYNTIPANTPCQIIVTQDRHSIFAGVAFRGDTSENNDKVLIFSNGIDNEKFHEPFFHTIADKDAIDICRTIRRDYHGVVVQSKNDTSFARCINSVTLLPVNFNQDFEEFKAQNKKNYESVRKKWNIEASCLAYGAVYFLYTITNGSKNFFFWALNMYFRERVQITRLANVMLWNEKYSQLSSKLAKGTITAYTNSHQFILLENEMRELRREKRINDVINAFNTQQKKVLKAYDKAKLTQHDKEAFSKFASMSLTKRQNFIRKMSTIEDAETILKHLRNVTNILFDWNKASLLNYLTNSESIHAHIIKDDNNIVLIKVDDYDSVKRLAKNTNWCISKNKTYWNNYVEHKGKATQYMLFNFDKKEDDTHSIIGFTSVADSGITNAHDFINNNLMGEYMPKTYKKSYFDCFNKRENIFGILDSSRITLDSVTEVTPFSFKWTKHDFLDFLFACVNRHNVTILCDTADKLCVSVQDSNIKYVLGESYMRTTESYDHKAQHILFLNFALPVSSAKSFYYSIIQNDSATNECYPVTTRNPKHMAQSTSFNDLLEEYGLPYDTIRRIDDPYNRFKDSLTSSTLAKLPTGGETTQFLKEYGQEDPHAIYDTLNQDVIRDLSFDFVTWIYDNGLSISELIGDALTQNLIGEAFSLYQSWSISMHWDKNVPSTDQIQKFWDEKITSREETGYIGYYLVLHLFIEHECTSRNANYILRRLHNRPISTVFVKHILTSLSNAIDMSQDESNLTYYIPLLYLYNCDELITKLSQSPTLTSQGKKLLEHYKVASPAVSLAF